MSTADFINGRMTPPTCTTRAGRKEGYREIRRERARARERGGVRESNTFHFVKGRKDSVTDNSIGRVLLQG